MSLLKQWRFVSLAIVAVLVLTALAACGDDDSGGSPTPTGGATTAGGDDMAPADQQKLVTQSGEPQFFDPHRSNFEQDIAIERMLFRGLYRLVSTSSGGAEVEPAYADGEPTVSADGKVFTVKIKSGLTWSDGEPITAEQFADGVKRGCDPAVASPYAYLLQSAAVGGIIGVKGCDEYSAALGTADAPLTPTDAELAALRDAVGAKAIDDTTLEITLVDAKLPSTFEDVFSLWVTFPARMDVIQQFGDQWTDPANIVVNGPFTLTEYVPQDHVTLKPNANYGLDGKAKLQQLTVKFIDDYSVAELAFKNGELDQTRVPDTDVPTLQADSTYADQTLVVGSARITALEMQLTDPVLAKDKVRLALSQAIDRDKLAEVTTSNVGLPAEYWLVKGLPGYQGRDKFKTAIGYNPTAAKQALADAGYADGAGFPELELTVLDTPVRKAQADFLKAAFKDVLNIDIKITAVDAKTRSAAFNSGNFQLFIGGWQLDYPDPENPIIGLFDTGGGNNKYNCSDAGIDAAITAGSKATTLADHIAQFQNAEDLIVTKVCGVAPFLQEGLPYLVSPKMGGVQANGTIDAGQPGNWCAECWYVKKS
ncbi:MAG TPA: ABC transporter substrate-binding protein [Dehalococcoidia bacterium]|nr:ABC transporter substrate-binding protein [Dehalococcoidia bacterium]